MTKTVQIWASLGMMNNNLEEKICRVASNYGGMQVKSIGGGGDYGSFYGVYRVALADGVEEDFITEVKTLTAEDGGGSYHYGSSKVTVKGKTVKVTDAGVVSND